jgi:hypothetical protein
MHAPPVIQVVMPPPTAIGAAPRPVIQGLRPPTGENDRCSQWSSADANAIAPARTARLLP